MEIQEKNRRGIPLWNITPDYKQVSDSRIQFQFTP